jgi:uncharacterized protein (DUF1697 family)
MQKFVALLRGINVGKNNRVPMEELRALLIEQGYNDVRTLLNSGNAVFLAEDVSPAMHATSITAGILQTFGISIPVIVKSANELATIIQENPLTPSDTNHSQLLVAFCQEPHELMALTPLQTLAVLPEQFNVGKHAAYLHCANGIQKSKTAKALLGKLGKTTTTRNWATVLKLHNLLSAKN